MLQWSSERKGKSVNNLAQQGYTSFEVKGRWGLFLPSCPLITVVQQPETSSPPFVIWPLQDEFLFWLVSVVLPYQLTLAAAFRLLQAKSYTAQAVEHVANGCLPGTVLHDSPPPPQEASGNLLQLCRYIRIGLLSSTQQTRYTCWLVNIPYSVSDQMVLTI